MICFNVEVKSILIPPKPMGLRSSILAGRCRHSPGDQYLRSDLDIVPAWLSLLLRQYNNGRALWFIHREAVAQREALRKARRLQETKSRCSRKKKRIEVHLQVGAGTRSKYSWWRWYRTAGAVGVDAFFEWAELSKLHGPPNQKNYVLKYITCVVIVVVCDVAVLIDSSCRG